MASDHANIGLDLGLPPWQTWMVATPAPLEQLIAEANFPTKRAFADACGLADYEISRISSGQRRPTGPQLRKISTALRKKPAEVAAVLLPEGEVEQQMLAEVIAERDALNEELGAVRGELVEAKATSASARADVERVSQEAVELQLANEQMAEDLVTQRQRADAAVKRRKAMTDEKIQLEQENRRLQRLVDETQNKLAEVTRQAARDLARLYQKMQDELGRERSAGLQRQILAGTLGAAAGAIIRGAANGRGRDDDDE